MSKRGTEKIQVLGSAPHLSGETCCREVGGETVLDRDGAQESKIPDFTKWQLQPLSLLLWLNEMHGGQV